MSQSYESEMGRIELFVLDHANEREGEGCAYVLGDLATMATLEHGPLTRVHSRCITSEIIGLDDCDCAAQLAEAERMMHAEGQGILFYLDQEGRGAGLTTKLKGMTLMQNMGLTTGEAYRHMGVPVDQREYGHCWRFLLEHSITSIRLLTNNPAKAVSPAGITVSRVPIDVGTNDRNRAYKASKRDDPDMRHMFPDAL